MLFSASVVSICGILPVSGGLEGCSRKALKVCRSSMTLVRSAASSLLLL